MDYRHMFSSDVDLNAATAHTIYGKAVISHLLIKQK